MQDDLHSLLMAGRSMPEGDYNHAIWQLDPKGHGQTLEALMVSAHESQHNILNQTTTYGILLVMTAHLERSGFIGPGVLLRLVNQCRAAHELYATYSSLLSMPDMQQAEQALREGYSNYISFVDQARWMLCGLVGRHLEEPVFNSLLTVCFQSPSVLYALANGTPFDLPAADSPDNRLACIANWLRRSHVDSWLTSYVDTHPTPEAARRWVEQQSQVDGDIECEDSLNTFRHALRSHVYECLRSAPGLGVGILEQDSHFAYLEALREYLQRVAPATAATLATKAFNQRSHIGTALAIFESEIVIQREHKIPAVVRLFSTLEQHQWHGLVLSVEGQGHVLVQSCITEQLILQFEFSDRDRQWLLSHRPDFFVAVVVKTISSDDPNIVFWVLASPDELRSLDMERMPMLAITSTLLSSDSEWQIWSDAIVECCTQVFFLDMSLSSNLATLFNAFNQIDYLTFQLHHNGADHVFVVFIGTHSSGAMGFFLAPCGPVTAKLIEAYAKELGAPFQLLDASTLADEINWLLRTVMTHSLDNHKIDFLVERSEYAQRCIKARRFAIQEQVA